MFVKKCFPIGFSSVVNYHCRFVRLNARFITYWKYSDSPLDILKVDRNCSPRELKSKFYELSKEYHPDKTLGLNEAARKSKTDYYLKIQLAYELLKDKESRDYYFVNRSTKNSGYTTSNQYQYQHHYRKQEYHKSDTEKTFDDARIWILTSAFIFITYSIVSKNYENSQKRELDLAWQLHYAQASKQGLEDVVTRR